MSYENLCYDQLAFKASHNSYDRDEDIATQLRWNDDKHYNGGCRSVEFDIVRHSDSSGGASESYFQVTHEQGGNGPTLASYLRQLLSFHEEKIMHDPILVMLDIKSEEGSAEVFPNEIDTYLRTWFNFDLICWPGRLMWGPSDELVAELQEHGWPTLADLKGQFLFCLSGNEKWKSLYADCNTDERLCFADLDIDVLMPFAPTISGNRAIMTLHLYSDQYGIWAPIVAGLRAQSLIVRGWVVNSEELWKKAQGGGVNALATDKISNYDWAHVGSEPFAPSAPPAT
jgi:Phosphoinositide phospholipase C, Ca2+-dependent